MTRRNCVWFVSSVALLWSESEEAGKHWKNFFKRTIPSEVSSSLLNWSLINDPAPFNSCAVRVFKILRLKYLMKDDTVCGEEGKTFGNLVNTFYDDNWPTGQQESLVQIPFGHNRVFCCFSSCGPNKCGAQRTAVETRRRDTNNEFLHDQTTNWTEQISCHRETTDWSWPKTTTWRSEQWLRNAPRKVRRTSTSSWKVGRT